MHTKNLNDETKYKLAAVIDHDGASVDFGHYTTVYCVDSHYYLYDDTTVKEMSKDQALNKEAYMLFYEMISTKDAFSKSSETTPSNIFKSQKIDSKLNHESLSQSNMSNITKKNHKNHSTSKKLYQQTF